MSKHLGQPVSVYRFQALKSIDVDAPAEACITSLCGHTMCKGCSSVTERGKMSGFNDCDAPASSAHNILFSDLVSDKKERRGG